MSTLATFLQRARPTTFSTVRLQKTRFGLFSLIISLSSATICRAEDPQIQAIPPDQKEVVLAGRPGNDMTLIGRITLLSSKAVPELLFRPGELHREGGTETVSRSQIQPVASGKLALPENTPQDFDFKVTGLKVPGTYTGSIDLLLPLHGISAALHFNLKVQVEQTPQLSLRKESQIVKIQIVNCALLRCAITSRLPPRSLTEDHGIPLDNGSSLPFNVEAAASATGDVNHHNTGAALSFGSLASIPARPIIYVPFQVENGKLVPDHYLGDIQLRIPGKDDPLKIPLEINVRDGIELPIIVLVLGILLGRLIKYMKDKGTPQSDLLLQLMQLKNRVKQSPADEQYLAHMLDQTSQEINNMQLGQAKTDIQIIDKRLSMLARLRFLESLLTPRAADPAVAAIITNIANARNQISLGNDPTPIATQIETAVQNLPAAAGGPAKQQVLAVATSVKTAATAVAAGATVPPTSKWRSFLGFLTGHEDIARAAFNLWFLRPLLYLVLVTMLVVVGLIQLYFKNPVFGADFINDYFGLLIWASGSDVASRTLTNVKGS